jgi:hypothetical protein
MEPNYAAQAVALMALAGLSSAVCTGLIIRSRIHSKIVQDPLGFSRMLLKWRIAALEKEVYRLANR